MIDLFLLQLKEMRKEFGILIDAENWTELSRSAHKVKSSALVMGAESMVNEMKELELLAKEVKNTEKYSEYIARFNTMADMVEVELNAYLTSVK